MSCVFTGCPVESGGREQHGRKGKDSLKKENFGRTPDGEHVEIYELTNANGVEARITTYGAAVVSLKVPDRDGRMDDVVLGFEALDGYTKGDRYFGAMIGRFANRIGKGRFMLNGTEYKLATNDGENHLHGGIKGFDKALWKANPVIAREESGLELTYLSRDGEEGYPGNLSVKVTYTLNDRNELRLECGATSDRDTVVNLTNHCYFNLAGQGEGDILAHELMMDAELVAPVDAGLIPSGGLRSVKGTPFDFTEMTAIGARINQDDEQIRFAGGYDHNFALKGETGTLRKAAKVREPSTGRAMGVWTTQPGLQFYSGNFLDGRSTGKGGKVYKHRYGFCLETQHFPDSPNNPNFPSVVLRKGRHYQTTTVYRFSAE